MSPDLKLVNGGAAPQPLPVIETLKRSFSFIGSNIIPILRVSIIPILAIIAAFELFGIFTPGQEPDLLTSVVPASLVSGAAMAVVMAAIGRMVLFNDVPQGFHLPAFGRDEVLTWMASILSGLLTALAGALPGAIVFSLTGSAGLAVVIAVVPLVYIAILLAQIYPVVLTTGRLDFRRSAEMGKGSLFQLLAVILLASIVTFLAGFFTFSLLFGVLSVILGEQGVTEFSNVAAAMFMVVIQVLMAGVNIVVVSFAFRWIDYYSPDPLLKDQQ